MRISHILVALICVSACFINSICSQAAALVNGSFEQGSLLPTGWNLNGKGSYMHDGGAAGRKYISIEAPADAEWISKAITLKPNTLYELRFAARCRPVKGPGVGSIIAETLYGCRGYVVQSDSKWRYYSTPFLTVDAKQDVSTAVRLSHWAANCHIDFDDIEVLPVIRKHAIEHGIELGRGEYIDGNRYEFKPDYGTDAPIDRAIDGHNTQFHENRWFMVEDTAVTYKHVLDGIKFNQVTVEASVDMHQPSSWKLRVEASTDGRTYKTIGSTDSTHKSVSLPVPADMLPAKQLYVRLSIDHSDSSIPGWFALSHYAMKATLDKQLPKMTGQTMCWAIDNQLDNLDISFDLNKTTDHQIAFVVNNVGTNTVALSPVITRTASDSTKASKQLAQGNLKPNTEATIIAPYPQLKTGTNRIAVNLGGYLPTLSTSVNASIIDIDLKGATLPSPSKDVALWWADSGWKISQKHTAPSAKSAALSLSLASNESEALQLVVNPSKPLKSLNAKVSALSGPNGAVIPASAIQLRQVRYVPVEIASDTLGSIGEWPDPLPLLKAGLNLDAGINHPIWICVTTAKQTPAGEYKGVVNLEADGFSARIPINVTVYGFTLPDESTVRSMFGYSPWTVWKYHNTKNDDQRRKIEDKYLALYASHRISPYVPLNTEQFGYRFVAGHNWDGARFAQPGADGSGQCLSVQQPMSVQYTNRIKVSAASKFSMKYRVIGSPKAELNLTLWSKDGKTTELKVPLADSQGWSTYSINIGTLPSGTEYLQPTFQLAKGAVGELQVDNIEVSDNAAQQFADSFDNAIPTEKSAKVEWSTEGWEAAMRQVVKKYHFNSFKVDVPGLGTGTFYEQIGGSLMGYPVGTPEHEALFKAWCEGASERLQRVGILDKCYVYPFDEPAEKDYQFVISQLDTLRKYFPKLHRMVPMNIGLSNEFVGYIDQWCPILNSHDAAFAAARHADGDRYNWYICCGPTAPYVAEFIDRPGTDLRVWLWQSWQNNVDGILVWESVYWNSSVAYPDSWQNPWLDSMSWVSGYGTQLGSRIPWKAGDGRFIYPPETATAAQAETIMDDPVPSIRLEMLRDGVEDYEYLVTLKKLIAEKGSKLTATAKAQYEALLKVPDSISKSLTEYTNTPEPIRKQRAAVAQAIERLMAVK